MWDNLEEWVPQNLRMSYWKAIARVRKIDPQDDIVCLLTVMGVTALISRQLPERLTEERKLTEASILRSRDALESMQDSCHDRFKKDFQTWIRITESLNGHLKGFYAVTDRMEQVAARMESMESVRVRIETLTHLLKDVIKEETEARQANHTAVLTALFVSCGIFAVAFVTFILWMLFA